MKRRLLNLLTALSLLLCAGSVALLACSGRIEPAAEIPSVVGRLWKVTAVSGRLCFTDEPQIELDKRKFQAESGASYREYDNILERHTASRSDAGSSRKCCSSRDGQP